MFLDYSNTTQSNIIPKQDFQELIMEVFNVVSSNLSKSLGPLGSNTTILDGAYTSATKDGYSIFKNFRFRNIYKNMIYNLIKDPCTMLNNTVGDGTTTAIVLTSILFQAFKENEARLDELYRLPRTFNKALDESVALLIEGVKKSSTPLENNDYDSIYNLCYVTSNGNDEISKNIAETYKNSKSPVIKINDSPTNRSYISPITGFDFPANLVDDIYVRNEDGSVTEKDIQILLFDYKVDSDICENIIIPINEIFKTSNKKLLIIAPYYDAVLMGTTLKQYANHEYHQLRRMNLLISQFRQAELESSQLHDLSVILRNTVISEEIGSALLETMSSLKSDGDKYDFVKKLTQGNEDDKDFKFSNLIGSAYSSILSCTNGSIFRVLDIENETRYQDALKAAELKIDEVKAQYSYEQATYSAEVSKATSRVSRLKMENYIYYVGADSALQKQIIHDAVEDVIKCTRSAVKNGIVPGCQLSIIRAANELILERTKDWNDINIASVPKYDRLVVEILRLIRHAVVNVYATVITGPDNVGHVQMVPLWSHIKADDKEGLSELLKLGKEKLNEVIQVSIERNEVLDLETLEYNKNIVTSTETDVNVLIASSELIKLLISGNQCVFIDAAIDNNVQDTPVSSLM